MVSVQKTTDSYNILMSENALNDHRAEIIMEKIRSIPMVHECYFKA